MKKQTKENLNLRILPAALILAVLIGVFVTWKLFPIGFEVVASEGVSYERAKVIAVNSESLEDSADIEGVKKGVQNITVRLTSGDLKGTEATFDNYLTATHSVEVSVGTRIIVKYDQIEGSAPYFNVYQYDRSVGIIIAFAVFALLICIVGRMKGLRAGVALLLSMFIIAFAVIPTIYNGVSPVLVSFIASVAIAAVTLTLLNGFSGKTFAAIVSTMIGLAASAGFYAIIARILSVTGANAEGAENLIMISRSTGLKISEVMFASILLASLGAVMDTAMSIASALFEIADNDPKLKGASLFRSGLNIGCDMIGTMCQTLVLAFTGSSLISLLVVVSYGTRFHQFLSSDFLACEILQALTGSFAVILTVPITALLCARILPNRSVKA